ncbi:hypothetical protein HYX08_02890 [Candidatus Woesearchaeota archaeon]|nr:hypothetical protein [Candidatus Woesearchaeota archaeon]
MKIHYLVIILLLLVPVVYAEEESCGLTNLATCIPQKLFQYILDLINAPLQPFLYLVKSLLSEPVNTEAFIPVWAIIVYILSIFYGLFIVFAGFNLIISGYSAEKRERAKEWLRNIVLMMVFVQASYYLYSIILEISASLTAGIINSIDPNFFLLKADNITDIGIQLILLLPYLITLLITVIFLSLRYLLVAVGVLFFPIGLFFNFLPPTQSYGKLIIHCLLVVIFLPFIHSLMLLAASKLVEVSVFGNYKTLVMIAAFLLINVSMIFLAFFVIAKAAMGVIRSDVGQAAALLAK